MKKRNDSAFYALSRTAQADEGLFLLMSSKMAPHLAETTSPIGFGLFR
ncbi:MAG: hypothetical protein LBL58_14215 [Tannerellaceae bacterium]|jgi:hypothetical protein|nr:hypothetical protein [Tannerellaceae bacterium]